MTSRLSEPNILHIWERGEPLHDIDRALLILSLVDSSAEFDALARLPLGERDRRLRAVYQHTFGSSIAAQDQCPNCRTAIEFDTPLDMVHGTETDTEPSARILADGLSIHMRPLNSRDLAAVAQLQDVREAEGRLLELAILSVEDEAGKALDTGALSQSARFAVSDALEQLDPNAHIALTLTCEDCGASWTRDLDIVSLLWSRIANQAWRLLMEIDALARSYGWTEDRILALGPRRRSAYLSLGNTA